MLLNWIRKFALDLKFVVIWNNFIVKKSFTIGSNCYKITFEYIFTAILNFRWFILCEKQTIHNIKFCDIFLLAKMQENCKIVDKWILLTLTNNFKSANNIIILTAGFKIYFYDTQSLNKIYFKALHTEQRE